MARSAVELIDVRKSWRGVEVIRCANWTIDSGETAVLFGSNGAGKSTIFGMLATIVEPDAGVCRVLSATRPTDVRRHVGFVAHHSWLTPALTLRENLRFVAGVHGLPASRADELALSRGLAEWLDRPVAWLSRGQLQRAMIAAALLPDPPVLLLDEPFTGLDAVGVSQLCDEIARWRREGRTVICSTHDLALGASIATRAGCLVRGKIFEPPPAVLADLPRLAAALAG